MMVVDRAKNMFTDARFENFPAYLAPGDCLVLNNTRVFPARLLGRRNRSDGAQVELFLLRSLAADESLWRVLAKPAKRVRKGDRILLSADLEAEIAEEQERGERIVRLHPAVNALLPVNAQLEKLGRVPLPPYIHRAPQASDRDRYQTVFAEHRGSVAAPTAGLHFTGEMLHRCRTVGAELAYVTLHVGLGTFAPLNEGDLANVQLHEEYFEFPAGAANKLSAARRRICIGTTSVRTLESALLRGGFKSSQGETNLFIQPGYRFRGTDAMLTNFHLPESSLLVLVCAFAGYDLAMAAYRHAVAERYRFFSYGDCMLIL